MGILTETRRNADVRARTDIELLALDWGDFRALLDKSDATSKDFIRMVDQRRAMIPE